MADFFNEDDYQKKRDGDNYSVERRESKDGRPSKEARSVPVPAAEKGGGAAVWIVTLLLLAAFAALVLWAGSTSRKTLVGSIEGSDSARYGQAGEYVVKVSGGNAKADKIIFKVDGKEVFKQDLKNGEARFDASRVKLSVGKHELTAESNGKVLGKKTIEIKRPLLKVVAPQLTVTYGESLPDFRVDVSGFVDGDDMESLGINDVATLSVDAQKVGKYPLGWEGFKTDKYDVEFSGGLLEITPKTVTVAPRRFTKVYDGSCNVENARLTLVGVLKDDIVGVDAKLAYDDKSVGTNKKVAVESFDLVGKDAANYALDLSGAEFFGSITPLNVKLTGLSANDKVYDGNTAVTFKSSGELVGVLSGDKVSVGEITARFEDCGAGENKKIEVDKISLVGEDAGNYNVITEPLTANITGKTRGVVNSAN
mgnify:FL=1